MPTSARTMSGGCSSIDAIAASPSLTEVTRTSSSAKVNSMTRWIVALSSARRRVAGTEELSVIGRGLFRFGPDVGVDELDDVLHWRAGQEHAFHANRFQLRDVHVRNDPADEDQHVV